jgi:hypothetical protein
VSVELIQLAADALGPQLLARMAFVGAAALPLWITEEGAPPPLPTRDVDVIIEVGTLAQYYVLGEELREQAFVENETAPHICAWRHRRTGLELDVMPTEEAILGFSNRWYSQALQAAVEVTLPSGTVVSAVDPPYLLATKLDAFSGRGRDANGEPDFLGSRDFGDIVALVNGRPELVEEVRVADAALRAYIGERLAELESDFRFEGGVAGALMPDAASQARRELVIERMRQMRRPATDG